MKSKIIGVGGGSCSGKTTLVNFLSEHLGSESCGVLLQDRYYYDHSEAFDHDGGAVNFDHPDAIDFKQLASHLKSLRRGRAIEVPFYDFKTHSRDERTETFEPKPIVLVDGILILGQRTVFRNFDFSIFVECDEKTRLKRRISRDVKERGRSRSGVVTQFESQVVPMHEQYVEPSSENADLVLSQKELKEIQKKRDRFQSLLKMILA